DMGVRDSFNPRENVLAGVRYLRKMLDRFGGDENLALAAYNAGPGTQDKYKGIPPFAEARTYGETVLRTKRALGSASGAGADGAVPDAHGADNGGSEVEHGRRALTLGEEFADLLLARATAAESVGVDGLCDALLANLESQPGLYSAYAAQLA